MMKNNQLAERIAQRVKIAQMRLDRDRRTRFRLSAQGRSVAENDAIDSVGERRSRTADALLIEREYRERVIAAIREFTPDKRYRELIIRFLILGESTKQIAHDLQIVYQSARRKVMFAKRYLQRVLR